MKVKWFVVTCLFTLLLVQICSVAGKRKKLKKGGKLKLKVGKSQRNTNLSAKQGKKQAKKAPSTDASISDYKPDEVKGNPSKVEDIKDKYESGTPPKFPEAPKTSDVTAHDSEITGCRDHPNALKVCQKCDEPCFGEEHETYTYSYCRRSCSLCDKKTTSFHQYWRLRAGSSFEPTWMLKEVEFYHLTSSNKSLIDDPKRGYAKNYFQGFLPSFAFDGKEDSAWFPDNYGSNHSGNDDWIAFEFPVAVRIHGVRIINDKDHPTAAPRKIFVEGSDKKFEGFETKWVIQNPTYTVDQISRLHECPVLWQKYSDQDDASWCFRLFAQRKSWDDAVETCQEEGGELASVLSKQEEEFLIKDINFCGYTWVGLSKQNGAYYWEDGSNSTFHDWKDDMKYSEDQAKNLACVAMNPVGQWILFDCGSKNYFVCKRKIVVKEEPLPELVPSPLPYPPEVPPVIFFYPNMTTPVINTHNLPAGAFPDANGDVVVPEDEDSNLDTIFFQQTVKHLLEKGLKPTPEMKPAEHEDPGKYTQQLNKIASEIDNAGTRNSSDVKPSVNLENSRLPQSASKDIPVRDDYSLQTPSSKVDTDAQMGVAEPEIIDLRKGEKDATGKQSEKSPQPVNGPPSSNSPPSSNDSDNNGTDPSNIPSNPSAANQNNSDSRPPSGAYQTNDASSQSPKPQKAPQTDATTSQKPGQQAQKPSDSKIKPPKVKEGTESNQSASVGEAGDEDADGDNDDDDDDNNDADVDGSDDDQAESDDDENEEDGSTLPETPNQKDMRKKEKDVDRNKDASNKETTVGGQKNKKTKKPTGHDKKKKPKLKKLKSIVKKTKQTHGHNRSKVTPGDKPNDDDDSSDTKELNDIIKSINEDII